jgi:hypothetical protein
MAKTNYTKVEEALDEGLRQLTKDKLHTLADSISTISAEGIEKVDIANRKKLIAALKFELNWMAKQDTALHQKLGLKKSEIKRLLETKEKLTSDDFEKIKQIKTKIDELKKELAEKSPVSDDQLIEKERTKHINKRFNTNDKWLPLH